MIKISVIIPVYRPGELIDRGVASLAAQTLPADEFEVIYIDDGSGDGTLAQLHAIAAGPLPGARVFTIEHSGWPSRPRNVGIGVARGEYLLFMDHDDTLYPDALRRLYEFARENSADVVALKESKTSSVWWGLDALAEGNQANVAGTVIPGREGIDFLQPMMPHKLYHRRLFTDGGIAFPDGSRVLWEDVYINVAAYRQAKIVSVLADTPAYRWHASEANTSHTFDHRRRDFWERLADVLTYIAGTLSGDAWRAARDTVTAWELGHRVIHRCVLLQADDEATEEERRYGLARARELLATFGSSSVLALLGRRQLAMRELILAGNAAAIIALRRWETELTVTVTASAPTWVGRQLHLDLETAWDGAAAPFIRRGGRISCRVDELVARALPAELLDVTDDAATMTTEIAVRSRFDHVTWPVTVAANAAHFARHRGSRFAPIADGHGARLVQRGHAVISLDDTAYGRPLDRTVWDVRSRARWWGLTRPGIATFAEMPSAIMHEDGPVSLYANRNQGLSIDLGENLRTFVLDARPRRGPAGTIAEIRAELAHLDAGSANRAHQTQLLAVPVDLVPLTEEVTLGDEYLVTLTVADGHLTGTAGLGDGRYALYARHDGAWSATAHGLTVVDGAAYFD